MRKKQSIRYKFLAVTTLLLAICVSVYLLIAIKVFERDKTELVFDYQMGSVKAQTAELEELFAKVKDRIKLIAYLNAKEDKNNKKFIQDLLSEDSDLIYIAKSYRYQKIDEALYEDKNFINTYSLKEDFFQQKQYQESVPFQKIQKKGESIWSLENKDLPQILAYGKSIVEENNYGVAQRQYVLIAYISLEKILKKSRENRLNEVFISTQAAQKESPAQQKLYQLAQKQTLNLGVFEFESEQESYLGAYSKALQGEIFIGSITPKKQVFSVVQRLIYRSLIFASIVFTLAFLFAIFFSRSLTRPIETLAKGMNKVSKGDLDTQIIVKSNDEISGLANHFNQMIRDLKVSRMRLEETNRNLEHKVKERTRELEEQNIAVKEAQEALLRTTRLAAVGEVAGQTAHEVLNPLTVMMTRMQNLKKKLMGEKSTELQLLQDIRTAWIEDVNKGGFDQLIQNWQQGSPINPSQNLWQEDIESIKSIEDRLSKEKENLLKETDFLLKEGSRINKIVQSMRTLSVLKIDTKEYDLYELLYEAKKVMADLASKIETEIKIESFSKDFKVYVDEDEFLQIMVNLIRNSLQSIGEKREENIDSPPPGLIRIEVQETDETYEIYLHDNGKGIEAENLPKLFETQFTTKDKTTGTGLGLSISRRLIRSFGGDVDLHESVYGKGACFVLRLPKRHEKLKETS